MVRMIAVIVFVVGCATDKSPPVCRDVGCDSTMGQPTATCHPGGLCDCQSNGHDVVCVLAPSCASLGCESDCTSSTFSCKEACECR